MMLFMYVGLPCRWAGLQCRLIYTVYNSAFSSTSSVENRTDQKWIFRDVTFWCRFFYSSRVSSQTLGSSARNTQRSNLQFGLFNVLSAVKKAASIHTLLAHDDLDVVSLTETWIRVDDPEAVKLDLAPSGYAVHHVPRTTGRGGGLAFYTGHQSTSAREKLVQPQRNLSRSL